jgi:hypothetical protein
MDIVSPFPLEASHAPFVPNGGPNTANENLAGIVHAPELVVL